mgnify:CR=1 FL=1
MPGTDPAIPTVPEQSRSPLWLGGVLLLVAAMASFWFVGQLSRFGETIEHRHGVAVVSTAAALLDTAEIAALRGDASDAGTPTHDAVRTRLQAVRAANPEFRFVYLMRPVRPGSDRFVFLADAEDPASPDYSAPGDVYEGPTDELRAVFESGQPVFSGAVEDDWGTWVSALAPIRHEGRVVAVLGVDMAHEDWLDVQQRYRRFGMIIAGLGLALATGVLALPLQLLDAVGGLDKRGFLHEGGLPVELVVDRLGAEGAAFLEIRGARDREGAQQRHGGLLRQCGRAQGTGGQGHQNAQGRIADRPQ